MNEYTREEGGEEVQDGEGVKRLVHNVESGDLCGDATTPSEMTACLLEGGTLLRSVSDATCAALKVSAAECEEVAGARIAVGALLLPALPILGAPVLARARKRRRNARHRRRC